jgi:hypothetical protein
MRSRTVRIAVSNFRAKVLACSVAPFLDHGLMF